MDIMVNNMTALKMLTIDDIKVGMRVFKEQLANIYDTWIIIYKPKNLQMEEDGIIGFIGKETNEESAALYTQNNIITPVYNDSTDLEGDIYEEWEEWSLNSLDEDFKESIRGSKVLLYEEFAKAWKKTEPEYQKKRKDYIIKKESVKRRFIFEVRTAEKSVEAGNDISLSELHEQL